MDLSHYIDKIFCSRTESNLDSELSLVKAIELHKEGHFLKENNREPFWNMVDRIAKEQPNLNCWKEEEIGKTFGFKRYEQQNLILNLAYYEAGRILSAHSDNVTLEDFEKWEDCTMEHGFFLGYEVGKEKLSALVDSLQDKQEDILMQSRCLHLQGRDALMNFCKTALADEQTDDDIIARIDSNNNGAYTELPPSITMLAYFINRDGHHDLLLRLMNVLGFFPLQGALLYGLHTVEDCLGLQECIVRNDAIRKKVLIYLLREREFHLMVQQQHLLKRNARNEYLKNDADRERASHLLGVWTEQLPEYITRMTRIWKSYMGSQELTEWLSRKQAQILHKNTLSIQDEHAILSMLDAEIYRNLCLADLPVEKTNLETLYRYAIKASDAAYGKAYYARLTERICRQLYQEKYVSPLTLDEEGLALLRALYRCIEKSGLDGTELMNRHRIPDEGYGCDYTRAMASYEADTLWLSVLILQTEHLATPDELRKKTDLLFRRARISPYQEADHYFLPFYIASMLVTQIHTSIKDDFEHRVISSISDIAFVLRILSANEGAMSEQNKALLKRRIDAEWALNKKLPKRPNKQIESFLEQYIRKLFA